MVARRAPFSIGGDLSGRPRPGSYYYLTHVNVTDPGRTWIAPFTIDGETEVRVNGKKLTPKQRIDKWGGTGEYFDLDNAPEGHKYLESGASKGKVLFKC